MITFIFCVLDGGLRGDWPPYIRSSFLDMQSIHHLQAPYTFKLLSVSENGKKKQPTISRSMKNNYNIFLQIFGLFISFNMSGKI